MSEIQVIIPDLESYQARMANVIDLAFKGLQAGPITVTLGRPKKSRDQEKHYHALIGEIARHVKPCGQSFSVDVFKALLVDLFAKEMEEAGTPLAKPGETVTSLDGLREVTVRPSTRDFRKAEAAVFICFLMAFGDEHGVKWSHPSLEIYESYLESSK